MWPVYKRIDKNTIILFDGTLMVTPSNESCGKLLYEETVTTKSIDAVAELEKILTEEINKEDVHDVMEAVGSSLEGSREYRLQTEVMAYAFMALKEDPALTISQAISIGYYEWVK